jgi:hypothetical protein
MHKCLTLRESASSIGIPSDVYPYATTLSPTEASGAKRIWVDPSVGCKNLCIRGQLQDISRTSPQGFGVFPPQMRCGPSHGSGAGSRHVMADASGRWWCCDSAGRVVRALRQNRWCRDLLAGWSGLDAEPLGAMYLTVAGPWSQESSERCQGGLGGPGGASQGPHRNLRISFQHLGGPGRQ